MGGCISQVYSGIVIERYQYKANTMNSFLLLVSLFTSPLRDTTSPDNTSYEMASVNISSQPEWGPTGYDYAAYYYLPDIETYYDVSKHQYIYFSGHRWNFTSLPPKYREVDLYNCYKVVINQPKPFLRFKEHKEAYSKFKGLQKEQAIIKNAQDEKFRNCWKTTDTKCQAWELCTDKKIRRNLKRDL
jgi:hypothetical protein